MSTTLLNAIRETAIKLKGNKLQNLDEMTQTLQTIKTILHLHSDEEAITFTVVFDLNCMKKVTTLESTIEYIDCSAIDSMLFVAPTDSLIERGYFNVVNPIDPLRLDRRVTITPALMYAIIEGKEINLDTMLQTTKIDQFDFCKAISNLLEQRDANKITTASVFANTESLEETHSYMPFIQKIKKKVKELEDRMLLYKMCCDFADKDFTGITNIKDTLKSIYSRPKDYAKQAAALKNNTHALCEAELIRPYSRMRTSGWTLTKKCIEICFGDDADGVRESHSVKSPYEFVDKINKFVDAIHYRPDEPAMERLRANILEAEDDNSDIPFVMDANREIPDYDDRLIFYLVCRGQLIGDPFRLAELGDICDYTSEMEIRWSMKDKSNSLLKKSLIEFGKREFSDDATILLTRRGKKLFLGDDADLFDVVVSDKDLIQPSTIKEKNLYFNDDLTHQIDVLTKSLSEENYTHMCNRLEEKGMSQGVAILFYGKPGTGKTECVKQLAKDTGRAVMHVDISSTKTCWFGESEKLIKEVFDKYRNLCETYQLKPILLFNEADAIFAKRKDTLTGSVAQTENTIQNIILEEIERLDGILIATTNLADNFDKAFERRFLFKVHFDTPLPEQKKHIWLDKLPSLSDEDAMTLANRYPFSGGEIDNICRKVIIKEVIEGRKVSFEEVLALCKEEKIAAGHNIRIGFSDN